MKDTGNVDIEHLRSWFLYEVDKEFSFRAVEVKLNLPESTLRKFAKYGPSQARGLGGNLHKVYTWALRRGYNPEFQYKTII